MNCELRIIKVLSALLLFTLPMHAQQTKSVEGFARIVQSDDEPPSQARLRVVEQARFNALDKAFGSNLSQNSFMMSSDVGGQSDVSFYMFGESDLRGTWVRDKGEPQVTRRLENNVTIWEATVKGEARELTHAKVGFEWQLMGGARQGGLQTNELADGESFFIKFRSPVKGYLLIFMSDGRNMVSCLEPSGDDEYCYVQSKQWHSFPGEEWIATLPEEVPVEYDQLYIVFSPNKIHPPITEWNGDDTDLQRYASGDAYRYEHVPELPFKNFQKYLGQLQHSDRDVQVEKMVVKIAKR